MKYLLFFMFFFPTIAYCYIPANGCVVGGGKTTCIDPSNNSMVTVNADGTYRIVKDGCITDKTGKILCADGSTDGIYSNEPNAPKTSDKANGFDVVVNSVQSEIDTLKNMGNAITSKVDYSVKYFSAFIPSIITTSVTSVLTDFWDFLTTSFSSVTDVLYSALKITDMYTAINSLSGGFGYLLELIGFNLILETTIAAYLVRFGIRRIPVVG